MWLYVYILRNASGKQYVGQSADVDARLKEHNEGSVTATKNLRPWHVEWFCVFRDKKRAIDFEKVFEVRFRQFNSLQAYCAEMTTVKGKLVE